MASIKYRKTSKSTNREYSLEEFIDILNKVKNKFGDMEVCFYEPTEGHDYGVRSIEVEKYHYKKGERRLKCRIL